MLKKRRPKRSRIGVTLLNVRSECSYLCRRDGRRGGRESLLSGCTGTVDTSCRGSREMWAVRLGTL